MGKAERNKGLSYEREVANKLKDVFPQAKRHLEFQKEECNGVDLDNTGNLLIQCKRGKKYAPLSKIKEIQPSNGIHCLVTRGDGGKSIVCLYLDDFIEILKDIGVVYEETA